MSQKVSGISNLELNFQLIYFIRMLVEFIYVWCLIESGIDKSVHF